MSSGYKWTRRFEDKETAAGVLNKTAESKLLLSSVCTVLGVITHFNNRMSENNLWRVSLNDSLFGGIVN
jgi:hypothetical protein